MKKFINEYKYKALRSKSETEASNPVESKCKVDSEEDMGVFKWLRRERVTVTTHHINPATSSEDLNITPVGTIRTEEYKRDLAEFQARRSSGNRELPDTPVKKKCGRNSLPVSCTDCSTAHDHTFNYEKKSAAKYKKKSHKRTRSATPDGKRDLPNIQFLFQNQVFMPGNMFPTSSFSEPQRRTRVSRQRAHRSPDFNAQKQIDFNEDELKSPPLFYKNNSLPYDVKTFLDDSKGEEEVDGGRASGDLRPYSRSSSDGVTKDDSGDEKLWEVMSELKSFDRWADEQLGQNASKSDDSKSDTSAYGLPIASACSLDVNVDNNKLWNHGKWGVVPVQTKKLSGVSIRHVKRKINTEINILSVGPTVKVVQFDGLNHTFIKCRHPNIILLMGLYPDVQNNVHIICERCVDSLFGILHVQGRILSAQTSVHYALDIANALVFLQMQGYVHTALTSSCIMVTSHDAAKLADLGSCVKLRKQKDQGKQYEMYSTEPQYVNIEGAHQSNTPESEPLISAHPSEAYLAAHAVAMDYETYHNSEHYRWQAPEMFEPEDGFVHPCAKSDVYSLCLILWESCNATVPWKTLTYEKLKEQYTLWKTGVRLPTDGTYPGCLLALLQTGLELQRSDRIDLTTLQNTLLTVKTKLDDLEYIIIPARLSKKKSNFSSVAWDTNSPTDDSETQSPIAKNIKHKAVVHTNDIADSSTDSEKDTKSFPSPLYETIRKEKSSTEFAIPETCYVSDDDNIEIRPIINYEHMPEKDFSSACSTPIAKIRARIKDLGTPGTLHRSDSTEYCSILSPRQIGFNDDSSKDQSAERPMTKLSRSFTPKSYKPLHIKVPECNLDSVKSILKDRSGSEKSSYNFDIKNYSLPTTPIARSNKLRKNAWLSGDLSFTERSSEKLKDVLKTPNKEECNKALSAPETPALLINSPKENDVMVENNLYKQCQPEERSPKNVDMGRDSFTGLRRIDRPQDYSPETYEIPERTGSWSFKSSSERPSKYKVEEDILANLNVKPLVAIHERWIYEANRKTGRSMSLPEDNRLQMTAVKPASHCVDTMQSSLPQLNTKRPMPKTFRTHSVSPSNGKNGHGVHWEQFCQARETIAKSINFTARDPDRFNTWKKDSDKGTTTEEVTHIETKIDQATDTKSIEEFIRELIRKEFQYILHEISDDVSSSTLRKSDEVLDKGVANIMENLRNGEEQKQKQTEKEPVTSFSRLKINGNNKPLLQITFSRSGENSLQVLDNCVNVTICDGTSGREKLNQSMEDTLTAEDGHVHALKRCQAFSAIQEARSTEDLYIDDDLSTQMQENFGGKVKLIPLHGSLHELLCEKEDECCLIKVKQENGCDTIYFRCDNSDTESRDAIDGCSHENRPQDTVVFKRSISLIEERIQRVFPKDKRTPTPIVLRRAKPNEIRIRPKSEVFIKDICKESRALSNSSPSLIMKDKNDEVEVNIENVMCYQDSSSEECLKCQAENDDFELLEKKIEEDLANSNMSSLTSGCLEKISEENLSVLADEAAEKIE